MPSDQDFCCSVAHEPRGVCVVTLSGRLDVDAVPVFDEAVQRELAAGSRKFVLDLGQLAYVGSLGLRSIIGLHNRLKGAGLVYAFDPTPGVQKVLDVTKIGQFLRVYPDRAAALDAATTF
jgi:anti-anti-sigma factor